MPKDSWIFTASAGVSAPGVDEAQGGQRPNAVGHVLRNEAAQAFPGQPAMDSWIAGHPAVMIQLAPYKHDPNMGVDDQLGFP